MELAILPCWRFLRDDFADAVPRLLAMMRGLGSPLASAYCHLYLVYRVQRLPACHNGTINLNLCTLSLLAFIPVFRIIIIFLTCDGYLLQLNYSLFRKIMMVIIMVVIVYLGYIVL